MKKVFSIVVFLILSIFFVACGEEKKEEAEETCTVTVMVDGFNHQQFTVKKGETLENHDFNIDPIVYSLDGWYANGTEFDIKTQITSDIKLDGYTEEKEYKIVFKNIDGRVLKTRKYFAYEEIEVPSNPTTPNDVQYEYEFAGWDQEFSVAVQDMTITATYKKTLRQYDVTILNPDGTTKETKKLDYGTKLTLDSPSKASTESYSYEFAYWQNADGTKFDNEAGIVGETILNPTYIRTPLKHSSTGMTISIVGDSISTFYKAGEEMISMYGGKDEFYYPYYGSWITSGTQTWWGQLISKLGGKLGVNNSLSGSNCYNWNVETQWQAGCNDIRLDTLDDNGTPDIIITFLGANDNVNGFTPEQFRYAYNRMLTKINQKYPNAYVFSMTMGYSIYDGYNYTEERRIIFNQIIREVAAANQVTVIDYALVHTSENYEPLWGDRLHFSKAGMDLCANTCYEVISNYLKEKE